jgi:hypothetical protein
VKRSQKRRGLTQRLLAEAYNLRRQVPMPQTPPKCTKVGKSAAHLLQAAKRARIGITGWHAQIAVLGAGIEASVPWLLNLVILLQHAVTATVGVHSEGAQIRPLLKNSKHIWAHTSSHDRGISYTTCPVQVPLDTVAVTWFLFLPLLLPTLQLVLNQAAQPPWGSSRRQRLAPVPLPHSLSHGTRKLPCSISQCACPR